MKARRKSAQRAIFTYYSKKYNRPKIFWPNIVMPKINITSKAKHENAIDHLYVEDVSIASFKKILFNYTPFEANGKPEEAEMDIYIEINPLYDSGHHVKKLIGYAFVLHFIDDYTEKGEQHIVTFEIHTKYECEDKSASKKSGEDFSCLKKALAKVMEFPKDMNEDMAKRIIKVIKEAESGKLFPNYHMQTIDYGKKHINMVYIPVWDIGRFIARYKTGREDKK